MNPKCYKRIIHLCPGNRRGYTVILFQSQNNLLPQARGKKADTLCEFLHQQTEVAVITVGKATCYRLSARVRSHICCYSLDALGKKQLVLDYLTS